MVNVNNRIVVVVAGSVGVLAGVWMGGVAVASGGDMPFWAVPAAVGVVAVASAVAWLLSKISHGGDWADGASRAPRSGQRHSGSRPGAGLTAPGRLAAGQRV
jgi:hypothetical protein